MQFLKDLISSLYKHIDTRISSPILGTLSAIFLIINWDKFILLILGSGNIESRVNNFKGFLNSINWLDIMALALLSLTYLFLLPLVNYTVGLAQGFIEHIRYSSSINQKVKNEKERGRLINSKYKSEHQSEIAAQEIIEEIAISNEKIEQQKFLTEKIKESCKAASIIIQEMYEKSKKTKVDLNTSLKESEMVEMKYARENMKKEREKLHYENIKHIVSEKQKISQLSLSFYLINEFDLSLRENSIKISFSGLSSILANTFGYSSFTKLLEDTNFNSESLDTVEYIIYSDDLISWIDYILEEENIDEDTDNYTVFECLQMMFKEKVDVKILTENEISERIRDTLEETGLNDLINCDEVSSSMAETNAYFDSVDDLQIINHELNDETFDIEFQCVISGTTHEDKPFSGDEINVSFVNKSEIVLGKFAIGNSEIEDIGSSVKDYHDDDDYGYEYPSPESTEKQQDLDF